MAAVLYRFRIWEDLGKFGTSLVVKSEISLFSRYTVCREFGVNILVLSFLLLLLLLL